MSRTIGALWSNEFTKDGQAQKYLSGVLNDLGGDIRIAIFKNTKKENDKQPDYRIVLSEDREDKPKEPAPEGEVRVDDIPF